MSADVKEMSDKKFVRIKLNAKNTALGLLSAHRKYLESKGYLGELLQAYDAQEILPTPLFQVAQSLVFDSLMAQQLSAAKASIAKAIEAHEKAPKDENGNEISTKGTPSGRYLISLFVKVYDKLTNECSIELGTVETIKVRQVEKNGELVDEKFVEVSVAQWGADDYGSAERLADRRLVSREDSSHAIIENQDSDKKVETVIFRTDAFARQFPRQKSALCKQTSKRQSTLKWHGRARQTHSVQPPR